MQIRDFIEQYKKDTKTAFSLIQIKTFILFKDKYALLKQVEFAGIDEEEGIFYYDTLSGDFLFDIAIIKYYTDLEFSDECMDELDELKRLGAFDEITDIFFNDYLMLKKHYRDRVQTILFNRNNTQNLINKEILKISDKAIETLDTIANNLDKKTVNKMMNGIKNAVTRLSTSFSENDNFFNNKIKNIN